MRTITMNCRMAVLLAAAFVLLPAALAPQAPQAPATGSDETVLQSVDAETLKQILGQEGYLGVEIDKDGDLLFLIDGDKVVLTIEKDKKSIMVGDGWSGTNVDLRKVNEWNRDKKYSRAYIDDEGDPVLELDLDLTGGVTVARIKDFLRTVRTSLSYFFREVISESSDK